MEPNLTPNQIQPENNQQNPMGNMQTQNQPIEKSSAGSIIATVVIIAIIVLGGLYFWGKRIETQRENTSAMEQDVNTNENASETAATAEAAKIENVSGDNSMSSIESDLKSTNTNNLGAEVNSL